MEGTHCYEENCNSGGLTLPIIEYDHSNGCSITGGYRYRGEGIPALKGAYVYGDYCSATIWTARPTGGNPSNAWQSTIAMMVPFGAFQLSSFGEDRNGELYVTMLGTGEIYKLVDCASVSDNSNFLHLGLQPRTCSWIGQEEDRRASLCRQQTVKENCTATCTLCA